MPHSWENEIDVRFGDSRRGFGSGFAEYKNDGHDVGYENDVSEIGSGLAAKCQLSTLPFVNLPMKRADIYVVDNGRRYYFFVGKA